MSKINTIIVLAIMVLLSVVFYFLAIAKKQFTEVAEEPVIIEEDPSIAIDCAQCEYFADSEQRANCMAEYSCK